MKILSKASETVLAILPKAKNKKCIYRKMHFCLEYPREDGVLLYNLLTRELLLLSQEEYAGYLDMDYLRRHWFAVPQDTDEKAQADLVTWVLSVGREKNEAITSYTIFTTTDCNARCFYCYELSRPRIPMDRQTAQKVVQYIKNHCGGQEVQLAWFGGEPLYHQEAMDIICAGLQAEGVAYVSKITTNAYLFDAAAAEKARSLWNLKRAQVTLDGTEATYNRIKAYIHKDGNPFRIVMDHLETMLNAQILVTVRLNMDLHNVEDLLILVEQLAERFGGRKNFHVYANHIFQGNNTIADSYSQEEWLLRGRAMERLEQKIYDCGLAPRGGVEKKIKLTHCMADSGNAVTILPGGQIGLCEHFSETEFIGHIEREDFDSAVVKSWKEKTPANEACATCFYYPACTILKKCPITNKCYLQYREDLLRTVRRQMECEYQMWKSKQTEPEGNRVS